MILNIRAGIIYNLCVRDFDKIFPFIWKDIILNNGLANKVCEYSILYCILELIIDENKWIDFNLESIIALFPNYYFRVLKIVNKMGYSNNNFAWAINYFMDNYYNYEHKIIKITRENISDRKGIKVESETIKILNDNFFAIKNIRSCKKEIYKDEFNSIIVHGRPDGIINEKCNYPKDTLVEIKYKHVNKKIIYEKDKMQISAYAKIFNTNVLFIQNIGQKEIICTFYKKEILNNIWENNYNYIVQNCNKFIDIFNNMDNMKNMKLIIDRLQRYSFKYDYDDLANYMFFDNLNCEHLADSDVLCFPT